MDPQKPSLHRRRWEDAQRVVLLYVAGLLMLRLSTPLGALVDMPELAVIGLGIGWGLVGAGTSHIARRIFFPGVDLRLLMRLAVADKQAGHVVLGICIVLAALLLMMGNARANELPPGAVKYLPVLADEQRSHWPDSPDLATLAAQIEQETCISLKHSRCWSPSAELRTSRERGVGFLQVTKTERFDTLAELRRLHPRELGSWSWDSPTLYDPHIQMRALVLMDRSGYERITGAASLVDRLAMMLVSHNAGPGRVVSNRRLCAATEGCDSARWFGHAEFTTTLPCRKVAGYSKCFRDVMQEYPRNVLLSRRERYVQAAAELL